MFGLLKRVGQMILSLLYFPVRLPRRVKRYVNAHPAPAGVWAAIILGLAGSVFVFEEQQDRTEARIVRAWNILIATDLNRNPESKEENNFGQIDAVEALYRSGARLDNIRLKGRYLAAVDLSSTHWFDAILPYDWQTLTRWLLPDDWKIFRCTPPICLMADLRGANLNEAGLRRSDLRNANISKATLIKADLSRANLSGANLSEAKLSEVDLSGANLTGARSVTQGQIDAACQRPGAVPPQLPDGFAWHGRVCDRYMEK